jgi:hypothetical protein
LSEDAASSGYGKKRRQFWISQADWASAVDERWGVHFCFEASSRSGVEAFHCAALPADRRDIGKPGLRSKYNDNYYAAFVADPKGYRSGAMSFAKS